MMEPHDTIRTWWDEDASVYDDSVGHAISDPVEAAAWRRALEFMLPDPVARVLDVGTGTGSLALLIAELGHTVTGLDLSDGMLDRARIKAEQAGVSIEFVHGHAGEPPSGPFVAVADLAAQALERFYGIAEHHHAEYPGDLSLPLQDVRSPMPFIEAVADAGWERLRLGRLRDVEWAIEHRQPWPLGMLTHRPRFAIIADAPA